MQRVFKGNTNDVTTLAPVAKELHDRFGVREPVLVGDKDMSIASSAVMTGCLCSAATIQAC